MLIGLFSGFGAKLPPAGNVSHQFPLNGMLPFFRHFLPFSSAIACFDMMSIEPLFKYFNVLILSKKIIIDFFTLFTGNPSHPYCSSIEEILVHYRTQLNAVQLYGPTNFAPVINNTISIATQFQDGRHYFVLLIITDGNF